MRLSILLLCFALTLSGCPLGQSTPATPTAETAAWDVGERLRRLRERGVKVFTLDYALQPENVARAIERSRALGLVPCVSRTPLDRLPQ